MKTNVKRTITASLLAVFLALPALGQGRIATIDLGKVFKDYYKREQMETALKAKGTNFEKEFKSMLDDYNKTKDEYTKLQAAASDQSVGPEERDKRKNTLDAKALDLKTQENTLQTYRANANEQLDTQKKRMRDTLLADIRAAINAKAKAGNYSMVIDTAGETSSGISAVVFSNGENDLTADILKQLNATAPPDTAPAETPKPDDKKADAKK